MSQRFVLLQFFSSMEVCIIAYVSLFTVPVFKLVHFENTLIQLIEACFKGEVLKKPYSLMMWYCGTQVNIQISAEGEPMKS